MKWELKPVPGMTERENGPVMFVSDTTPPLEVIVNVSGEALFKDARVHPYANHMKNLDEAAEVLVTLRDAARAQFGPDWPKKD